MSDDNEKTISRSITESTLIPLSLVITILGGAGFITYLYFQTNANAEAIKIVAGKVDAVMEIKVDIGIIKTKVEAIERRTPYRDTRGRDAQIRQN